MHGIGFLSPDGCNSPETTRLIVLRGNSASGKSSIAAEIRFRFGRGIAIVSQDYLRRTVLKERDHPGGANIGLIDLVARYTQGACKFGDLRGCFAPGLTPGRVCAG